MVNEISTLGALAKLRKATISFIMFVRPDGETQFLRKDLCEIWYENFLENLSREFNFH